MEATAALAGAQTGADEPEPSITGENADEGKLFEVPRVAVTIDDSDPNVLRLAFSGSITLDRSVAANVDFYNSLVPGKTATLSIDAHVAGAKTTHRRDDEGDVIAVVQTKSLIIHSINED